MLLKKLTALLAILCWFSIGIYTGVCGLMYEEHQETQDTEENTSSTTVYMYNHIAFSSQARLNDYMEQMKTDKLASWIASMPGLVIVVLSSCGLGALGGIIGVIRTSAFEKVPIENTQYIVLPFLGFMLGMVVLAISYLIPTVLETNHDIQIRQTTLMCFCLFAGLFSKSFLTALEGRFGTFLKTAEKHNQADQQTQQEEP